MNKDSFFRSAERLDKMTFSPVRKVLERARELENMGRSIVHFEIGEPDFDTPKVIAEATIDALKKNLTHYGPNRGRMDLRKVICKKLKEENGLSYDADEEIIITVGAAEAILDTVLAFVNEGDEVIVFTPAFMNYENLVHLADAKAVTVPLLEKNGFQIDPDAVRAVITNKTQMIIVNNPHNPTGTVFNKEILKEIAEIAMENNLLVLSDEIYEQIIYDGAKCYSMAAFDGMKERTITVNGFSKTYAMTGWRLGYLATDRRLIPPILKLHQYVTTCAPTFLQAGVAATMEKEECRQNINNMISTFAARRRLLLNGLKKIEGITFVEPKGAFYAFINVSRTGLKAGEFAAELLEKKGVALVAGEGFGKDLDDYVRISYAVSESEIQEGLIRIGELVRGI